MTVSDLLSNEELRRHEFPVAREKIFLAHAGVCPLPRRVAEAVQDYATLATENDQEELFLGGRFTELRQRAAQLLQALPEEVAFVGPTSLGLSFIASGLDLRKNDNILIYLDDYPANVYPWMALADKGVQVRLLNIRELGRVRLLDIKGQVDEQTNLVGLVGLQAALELLLELGIDNIATELLRKRTWLVPALQAKGYTVLQAGAPPENASAIVTFHRPGADLPALHQKLLSSNIITS